MDNNEYENGEYYAPLDNPEPTPQNHAGSGVGGLIVLGLIIFGVWFLFLRVDYKDVWWKDTEYQRVVYCGPVGNANCHTGNAYTLPVTHLEKSGDTHTFRIKFDNGGSVETYGNCMKDESDLYPNVERYCFTTSTNPENGNIYTYLITK